MRVYAWFVAAAILAPELRAEDLRAVQAPAYTASSIVNSASLQPGLAPNTIATIFGSDLAYTSRAIEPADLQGGALPTVLMGTGVRVTVNGVLATPYFVSPKQINFLIPANLLSGPAEIQVSLDGRAGPVVRLQLNEAAPALFQLDRQTVIATRANGSLLTRESPALPGEIIVLYGTGFGATRPRPQYRQIPTTAAALEKKAEFQVLLGSVRVPEENILYVGLTPGNAGLYQINLRLPPLNESFPEISVGYPGQMSPTGVRLPAIPAQ